MLRRPEVLPLCQIYQHLSIQNYYMLHNLREAWWHIGMSSASGSEGPQLNLHKGQKVFELKMMRDF